MEKVVCALWAAEGDSRSDFNQRLRGSLPAALCAAGASRIRLNLRDDNVAPGDALIQRWQAPQQDAVIQFWLPTANAMFRAGIDVAIAAHCERFAAWLVAESTIIANSSHPPQPGLRTWGWSQASFISFRPDLDPAQCLAIWQSHHTRIAVETQANFEYIQNRFIQSLTEDAPDYDAFVEECFPVAALSDPLAFFDAVGDQARFDANLAAMMDSCGRFIDFARIDILPTSQYDV